MYWYLVGNHQCNAETLNQSTAQFQLELSLAQFSPSLFFLIFSPLVFSNTILIIQFKAFQSTPHQFSSFHVDHGAHVDHAIQVAHVVRVFGMTTDIGN